jgi:hypothetical protein
VDRNGDRGGGRARRPGRRARLVMAGGWRGAEAVHARPGSLRGWPASWHRHRGGRGRVDLGPGGRTGDVCGHRRRQRQDRHDRHARRVRSHPHASRSDLRPQGRRGVRGCFGRARRLERHSRVGSTIRPSRDPRRVATGGLRRSSLAPACASCAGRRRFLQLRRLARACRTGPGAEPRRRRGRRHGLTGWC